MLDILVWGKSFVIVVLPFLKMALLWVAWQLGVGGFAWSSARIYSFNCAPPGVSGYVISLFSMGNPICVSLWFSHAAFVVAYITSFVAAILIVLIWLYKRSSAYPMIKRLQIEIKELKRGISPPDEDELFRRVLERNDE